MNERLSEWASICPLFCISPTPSSFPFQLALLRTTLLSFFFLFFFFGGTCGSFLRVHVLFGFAGHMHARCVCERERYKVDRSVPRNNDTHGVVYRYRTCAVDDVMSNFVFVISFTTNVTWWWWWQTEEIGKK